MAELARADELVRTLEGDTAFRAESAGAPTMEATRMLLDAYGFHDIGIARRADVEGHRGAWTLPAGVRREIGLDWEWRPAEGASSRPRNPTDP